MQVHWKAVEQAMKLVTEAIDPRSVRSMSERKRNLAVSLE